MDNFCFININVLTLKFGSLINTFLSTLDRIYLIYFFLTQKYLSKTMGQLHV